MLSYTRTETTEERTACSQAASEGQGESTWRKGQNLHWALKNMGAGH